MKCYIFARLDHTYLIASEAGLRAVQVTNSEGPEWEMIEPDYDPQPDLWLIGVMDVNLIDTPLIKQILQLDLERAAPLST